MVRPVSRARLRICKPRRQPKQKRVEAEILVRCDQCGDLLGRTCIRTDGSAACAAGCGIAVKKCNDVWRFFCCKECEMIYCETHQRN